MAKVSVIIPIYNVERYLERCLNSVINQTEKDFEIIIVNDGSTDSSGQICDEFANTHPFIRVLHQSHQGVSSARNNALSHAVGEWIAFCDGDDWYEPLFLEKMLYEAHSQQADYVICNYKITAEGRPDVISGSLNGLYSGCDPRLVIAIGPTPSCTHLIKRELFEISNVGYPVECERHEELPVIPVLAKYSKRIAIVNEPLYNYYQRGDGTSASNIKETSDRTFRLAFNLMCQALGEEYEKETEYHAVYALLYGRLLKLCKEKAKTRDIISAINQFKKEFPNYNLNPYLKKIGRAKRIFLEFAHLRFVPALRLLSWMHSKIIN